MTRIHDTQLSEDEWRCETCLAINSTIDGECQFCDCQGNECTRWNCSGSCQDVEVI